MEYIFATMVVFVVGIHDGEQTNVRVVLEDKITAQECINVRKQFVELNVPMETTLVSPGWDETPILFNPRNLVCEPFIES